MIPLVDLRRQYHTIKPAIDAAIARVLESGQFVLGPEVEAFEREFSAYCGVQRGVAVNSGTSALHLALLAAGIKPGDEVITVPFTFVATAAAICYAGARPVFVDIEHNTFTMDVNQIEAAITSRTRAILPVHLYGQAADLDPILDIAERRKLVVIEDACQAHGAFYKSRPVGSLGDAACFSFYPGKNLGACGEGGILVTSREDIAREARMLRDWGQQRRHHHLLKGFNYRMDGLQGAILRVKLQHLDRWIDARRAHAAVYDELLDDGSVLVPCQAPYAHHVYQVYAVRHSDRDSLARTLHAHGIATGIHYPVPVHLQPAYADLGYRPGDFPQAERAANEVLSLPLYPELTRTQVEMVSAAVLQEAYAA